MEERIYDFVKTKKKDVIIVVTITAFIELGPGLGYTLSGERCSRLTQRARWKTCLMRRAPWASSKKIASFFFSVSREVS